MVGKNGERASSLVIVVDQSRVNLVPEPTLPVGSGNEIVSQVFGDLRCRMSLATCSRFFRPCVSRIRPALNPLGLSGCRLFSSLQKRPNFVASRLPAARHASGGNKGFGALLSENGLLVLGIGLLGSSLAYVRNVFAAVLYFKLCIVLRVPQLSPISDVVFRSSNRVLKCTKLVHLFRT